MDSSDLYHVKQQFILGETEINSPTETISYALKRTGAYQSIANITLPDPSSSDYTPFLLYKSRALIALNQAKAAVELIPEDAEALPLKAARSLARYVDAASIGSDEKDATLEELRDLCVEVEGEEASEIERGQVRVLAGTAFAREGEVEEALETLGVGSNTENLEAVSLIVQIYLSIDRPDLAKKEYERALKWAEDDLLLQSIEASIGLVTGSDAYQNSFSYYSEQLANPSLSSPHLLTARAVTRLLRGEVNEAKSDLEEVLRNGEDEEGLCASVVAAGLGQAKKGEADELYSKLASKYPSDPLVREVKEKSTLFDELASKFEVPALAVPTRA